MTWHRAKHGALGGVLWLVLKSSTGLCLASSADEAAVVARAGNAVITASSVEQRLASLSRAELALLGGTVREAPRHLVEQVLALELAAELEARERGLDKSAGAVDRTREILREAMDGALRQEALKTPVSDQEIAAYFEANRARFEQPERVRIWRILVNEEALAQEILKKAREAGNTTKWSELSRQHSVDKATHMRQGDLGFVHADGSTDVPRVRVNPELYRGVEALKDGELAPLPIPEAGKFAVVWRRGSLPKKSRTLAEERDSIRRLLERNRVQEARQALLTKLRAEHVRAERLELLELIPEGLIGQFGEGRERAVQASRPAEAGSEPPKPTERGLR